MPDAAARKLGIDIPTLCFLEGRAPQTSCMVCLVKVDGGERLLPACATKVRDGMRVESETDEVRQARRMALELLLGDHLGDCIAPCHAVCPAHINIPRMIRQIASGRARGAAVIALRCRDCAAPCENACRRAVKDHAVSIRLLVRYAAEFEGAVPAPPVTAKREYSVHIGRVEKDDDCRRPGDCRLRKYAAACGAKPNEYRGERRAFEQHVHPQNVVYEPGKCIACGLCVRITRDAAEPLGLTFIGRGFNVRVAVPFDGSLEAGLQRTAAECVDACPTGALAFKDDPKEA